MKRPLIAAAVLFLVTSTVVSLVQLQQGSHIRFDWPDETANAFFAKRIAATAAVAAPDPDIALLEQRLHPRSVNVIGSRLVPGGFLGLPFFYGTAAAIVGFGPTLFFTPLLVFAAALVLFFGLRPFLNQRHATYATILFLFHPAVWYFSAYSYLPNMPFVALIVAGLGSLLFLQGKRGRIYDAIGFLSGAAAGAALAIRPVEVVWCLPILLLTLWPHRHIRTRMLLWVAGAAMFFLPVFALHFQVFGTLLGGYARFGETASGAAPTETVGGMLAYVLPFGFHPFHALARFWDSFVGLFWWYSVFAVIGIILAGMAAVNEPSRRRRMFVRAMLLVSAGVVGYLVLLYGSWRFADAEILAVNNIGRSYVRYWLPIAVLMSIAAAAPLSRAEGFPELRVRVLGRLVTAAMIVGSFLMAFVFPKEALLPVAARLAYYEDIQQRVAAVLPSDAIILTQRMDKVFFPEYRVIALEGKLYEDDQAMDLVARLAGDKHFYAADAFVAGDLENIVAALSELGVRVETGLPLNGDMGVQLYALTPAL